MECGGNFRAVPSLYCRGDSETYKSKLRPCKAAVPQERLMKPRLIDVHTHVQFAAYTNDMDAVIKRSLSNGVWLVSVGTQKDTSAKAVEVAEKYKEGVYAPIGLHPIHTEKSYHDVKELGGGEEAKEFTSRGEEFDYEYYKNLGGSAKVLAVGECVLDYYRLSEDTKKKQAEDFEAQISLAAELGKPL